MAEEKFKIEYQEIIKEVKVKSYEVVRLKRVKYIGNNYYFIDIRFYQRGYDNNENEIYFPTTKGIQIKEGLFYRLLEKYFLNEQSDNKLLLPKTPFSNKKAVRNIISSCREYIYWVDKYFSRAGLDLLADSINVQEVKNIRILMSPEKVNVKFLSLYKDLEKEFKDKGVKFEIRGLTDRRLGADIHDRWVISKNLCYNIPSTDTIARGQYSEVRKTENFPPFHVWWRKSKDIKKLVK